jgi:hypothetical protein
MDSGTATVIAAAISAITTVAVKLIASRTKALETPISSVVAARPVAREKKIRRLLRTLGWVFVALLYLVMALYVLLSLVFLVLDGDSVWLNLALILGVGAILLTLAVWSTRRLAESSHQLSN